MGPVTRTKSSGGKLCFRMSRRWEERAPQGSLAPNREPCGSGTEHRQSTIYEPGVVYMLSVTLQRAGFNSTQSLIIENE